MNGLKERKMKGFIFTVDAIFALIVSSAAISILLFSAYIPSFSSQSTTSEASSVMLNLLNTNLSQAAATIPLAKAITLGWANSQYTWPQYGYNASLSSFTPGAGPLQPTILWSYQTYNLILASPVVADGLVVFSTSGTNSILFGLNATNGKVVFTTRVGNGGWVSGFWATTPLITPQHLIWAANSFGRPNIYSENGMWLFAGAGGATANAVGLFYQDGLVENKMILWSPVNGTRLASSIYAPAAYANGEFIAYGPATATTENSQVFSFAGGTSLIALYQKRFITNAVKIPNPIAASNGFYVVTGGTNLYVQVFNSMAPSVNTILTSNAQGGAVVNGSSIYVETENSLQGFSFSRGTLTSLFKTSMIQNNYNTTPSGTPSGVYAAATLGPGTSQQTNLMDFNPSTGAQIWNISLFSPGGYEDKVFTHDIPVAYGNVYTIVGNTIYDIGMCTADPSANLLADLATLYMNGHGSCATALLNKLYPSSKVGIYINGTYAPLLSTLSFSQNMFFRSVTPEVPVGNTMTATAWIYPYPVQGDAQRNGVVGWGTHATTANSFILGMQSNGLLSLSTWNNDLAPTTGTPASFDKWNFIAATLSGNTAMLYVNGNVLGPSGLSVPTDPVYVTNGNLIIGGTNIGASTGRLFNGIIADVQIYNKTLTTAQVQQIYQEGLAGAPLANQSAMAWFPMEGDVNDYLGFNGFYNDLSTMGAPISNNIVRRLNYTPPSLQNSYQVSRSSVPMSIDVNGTYGSYNVSVVVWR